MRRVLGSVTAAAVGLASSVALATPAYTPPDGLGAADVQADVFAVIAPAIPVILGIGATMTVVWAVYRVITRKSAKRA